MSECTSTSLVQDALDPFKRVNYTMGLVLGVDEFTQEQTYLLERDRLHNRALHGYGTVHGLQVTVPPEAAEPMVMVTAGMAVDPPGQHICVPADQCARLNDWLARQQNAKTVTTAQEDLPVYVLLCYRECETDSVPIPGGPCRSQDETMAASRIADDFELKLSLTPPAQVEEDVIREFGDLLARIEITATPGEFASQGEILALVRALGREPESPPDEEAPADPGETLRIHPNQARGILRAAFRVWSTEVRPNLVGKGCKGASFSGDDTCVLLAELRVDVEEDDGSLRVAMIEGEGGESVPSVTIHEGERPYLLSTRVLQEWLLTSHLGYRENAPHTFATLATPKPSVIRAWIHHPILLEIPSPAVTVQVLGLPEIGVTVHPHPGTNVFDLELPSELPENALVTVRFDAARIRQEGRPRWLLLALDRFDYGYLDRDGDELLAYLACQPTIGELALDDLTDVDASSPADGQVIVHHGGRWQAEQLDHGALDGLADDDHPHYLTETRGDLRYAQLGHSHPHTHALGELSDVSPAAAARDEVLTWTGSQWEPQPVPSGPDGRAYVQAPHGTYAIVAAGFFNPDGSPRAPTYNALRVVGGSPNGGVYLLRFPEYDFDRYSKEEIAYIVKGTVYDPSLNTALESNPLDDKYIEGRLGLATFQVVEFDRRGIFVWITQPTLRSDTILAIIEQGIEGIENLLHLRPVPRAFMVEISQYPFQSEPSPPIEGLMVNVGTASVDELRAIPRVGPTLAEHIVATRTEMGGFTVIEDLVKVPGIGEGNLEHIRPFITLGN